jgi:hypothetical protein
MEDLKTDGRATAGGGRGAQPTPDPKKKGVAR